jgi:hypothetical protein
MSSLMKPGIGPAAPEESAKSGASPERERARRQLERKRKFYGDVVAYVVINAFLIVVWAVSGFGYFWPGWVAGGWGVLLLLDAWGLYYRRPITEADIDRELHRH